MKRNLNPTPEDLDHVDALPLPTVADLLPLLTPSRGKNKGKTLKTNRPDENGFASYVWRMARFHAGIDTTWPVLAFFYLQNWVNDHTETPKGTINVSGVFSGSGKLVLDYADRMVDEVLETLGYDPAAAVKIYRGLLY